MTASAALNLSYEIILVAGHKTQTAKSPASGASSLMSNCLGARKKVQIPSEGPSTNNRTNDRIQSKDYTIG
jgi:hypothetical protein